MPSIFAVFPATNKSNVMSHKLSDIFSFDIVFTSDKSKWTRCPVVETDPDPSRVGFNTVHGLHLRNHASWDNTSSTDGNGNPSYNPADSGMSWFPGYAINLETGERLNIIFGEDSWYKDDNGNDMLWNPSSTFFSNTSEAILGARHYIYIMKTRYESSKYLDYKSYLKSGSIADVNTVFDDAIWVGAPMQIDPSISNVKFRNAKDGIIPKDGDLRLKIRVRKPYTKYDVGNATGPYPTYPRYSFA